MTEDTSKKKIEAVPMNTFKYLGHVYDSISPIGLVDLQSSDLRFYRGTGFFIKSSQWEDIFFVTAKHCVCDSNDQYEGELLVHLDPNNKMPLTTFSYSFYGVLPGNKFPEDIVIYAVDNSLKQQIEILQYRCLFIPGKLDVDTTLSALMGSNTKLRLVGSPDESRTYIEKVIIQSVDFPDCKIEIPANTIDYRLRGLHGDLTKEEGGVYLLENINWPGDLNCFSGSPVIHLERVKDTYLPIPVGVVIMGGNKIVRFIPINIVTGLIKKYIANPQDPDLQVRTFDKQVVQLYS